MADTTINTDDKKPVTFNPPVNNEPKLAPANTADAPAPKDPKGMFDWSDAKQYVIQEGETLLDVALKYHVALQQLRYFNHLNKVTFKVNKGQTIYIPNKPINVPYGA